MENLKPYTASVTVKFEIDFDVMAKSEEYAQTKIDNLLEIIGQEATIDCKLASEYDVHVDCTAVDLNAIYSE